MKRLAFLFILLCLAVIAWNNSEQLRDRFMARSQAAQQQTADSINAKLFNAQDSALSAMELERKGIASHADTEQRITESIQWLTDAPAQSWTGNDAQNRDRLLTAMRARNYDDLRFIAIKPPSDAIVASEAKREYRK